MNVIFLDCTQNYGRDYAARNSKVEFMVRGLRQHGVKTTIINGIDGNPSLKEPERISHDVVGTVYTYPFYGKMMGFQRNAKTLAKDLKRLFSPTKENFIVLASPYLHFYLIYLRLARKYGYKVVVIADEWVPSVHRRYWIQNVMAKMYSQVFGYGVNGILPISEYIIDRINKFKKPWLKTPVLASFTEDNVQSMKNGGLVYCVFAAYRPPIQMILDSYKVYVQSSEKPMPLTLVLTGSRECIEIIEKDIRQRGLSKEVEIKVRLPYSDLLNLFKTAKGLLIPLNPNNEQDWARFSQKIAEYVSGGSTIITNPVGEINYYFTDKETALICDYDVNSFADTFKWIEDHIEETTRIGNNGFNLGKKEFNLEVYGSKLYDFLKSL